jgi:TetR/AcrR family transcriptional regulator, transcriptional repressor for nem operon
MKIVATRRRGTQPADMKDRSHQRIQAAAARLLRRDGLRGASVRKVMAAAGLTGGGFYAHFRSKEILLQEAFSFALREKRRNLAGTLGTTRGISYVETYLRAYLTADHRDSLQDSCPYSALLSELPRAGRRVRARVREEFVRGLAAFAERLDLKETAAARRMAILVLCLSFGALAMSRTLAGYPEADELLRVASSASKYWRVE